MTIKDQQGIRGLAAAQRDAVERQQGTRSAARNRSSGAALDAAAQLFRIVYPGQFANADKTKASIMVEISCETVFLPIKSRLHERR